MNLQYTHLYILCIWTLTNVGCHAKKNDNLVKRNETKKEKDVKMNETHGRRYYRNAFYYVQHVGQVLLFVASAFTERHHVDPLVSGSYKVLYANPVCFVAATNPRSGKEACLLWRLARPRQHERYSCRAAFNIYCSSYTGHRVFYTRELCATRNAIRRPNGVLQSLGKGPE
ncbi:uncharacterized protein LOC119179883 isoform X4 [Rhipicephalus microplus]|uniref:uncharacterized protein LOC119179883 isoform X4 n=1 Tax=Rhipicephalus microplus TaxID=6941 RepID=UPI003F6AA057